MLSVPQPLHDGFGIDIGGDGLQDQVFHVILGLHMIENLRDDSMTGRLEEPLEGSGKGAGGSR